jgi:hypothetical protein
MAIAGISLKLRNISMYGLCLRLLYGSVNDGIQQLNFSMVISIPKWWIIFIILMNHDASLIQINQWIWG